MTKPYYEEDGITIYCGDCRDILPELPKVDLVLTDPPYGIRYHSGYYKHGNPHKRIANDDAYPVEVIRMLLQKARCGVMAFCRWDTLPMVLLPTSMIVWVKNNHTAGDLNHQYARRWEACLFWRMIDHEWANGRPVDVIYSDRVSSTNLQHPTEKPTSLLQRLIGHHVGASVLDPFMGSGTTLVAAKNLGRQAIGIEINQDYCDIAVERLAQGVLTLETKEER